MRTQLGLAIGATAVLLGAGCSSSQPPQGPDVSISLARTGPLDSGLTASTATVPAGVALGLVIQPYTSTASPIAVRVGDPGVASVVQMTSANGFVLIGITPGVTALHFFIDGRETNALSVNGTTTSALNAEVTAQPAQ